MVFESKNKKVPVCFPWDEEPGNIGNTVTEAPGIKTGNSFLTKYRMHRITIHASFFGLLSVR